MVGKLIKNEFLDSRKSFLPVVLMIVSVTTILLLVTNSRFQGGGAVFLVSILMLVLFGLFVAIFVMWVMAFINLLYKSVYNKNGYRLFTMPVKTWEIVVAKTAVYFLWLLIIGVVTFISVNVFLLITFSNTDFMEIYSSLVGYIFSNISLPQIILMVLSFISNNLVTIATILVVGAIANSAWIQNQRSIKAFLMYVVLTAVISRVTAQFLSSAPIFNLNINDVILSDPTILDSFNPMIDSWSTIFSLATNVDAMQTVAKVVLLEFLMSGLLVYGTLWVWDHKLEILN